MTGKGHKETGRMKMLNKGIICAAALAVLAGLGIGV